jgi:hypothetical protein
MTLRLADFYASTGARRALRAARCYRNAADIAAAAGATPHAVRMIRAHMRNFALVAVAEARRTRELHTRIDSEIGPITPLERNVA